MSGYGQLEDNSHTDYVPNPHCNTPTQGWHLDIGPGFNTDSLRTLKGHPFQGCVVLVLLTDCPAGFGGTAFIPGSHRWVEEHLREAGRQGRVDREEREGVDRGVAAEEREGVERGVAVEERGVPHQELNSWAIDTVAARLAVSPVPSAP